MVRGRSVGACALVFSNTGMGPRRTTSADARLALLQWVGAGDDWVPFVGGKREEGRGTCRCASWAKDVTPAHAGKRRSERGGVGHAGPRGEREREWARAI
jgi:hypothetical protein